MSLKFYKNNKAFALLYTALISSLLLSLALSITFIVDKELVLSSIARESQRAFYMADSAVECALYWDFRFDYFNPNSATVDPNVKCMGVDITSSSSELSGSMYDGVQGIGGARHTNFKIDLPNEKLCAIVRVKKKNSSPKTVIEAEGYNTSCDTKSKIRLQRAVKLRY